MGSRDGAQLRLLDDGTPWRRVTKWNRICAALADRHYSRQSVGSAQYMPPGITLVLLVDDDHGQAVWGACKNLDPVGNLRARCTIFRNESSHLSSDLIRLATPPTQRKFGPHPPLTTEVDPEKVRQKRDPGRCFLRAGWTRIGIVNGLIVLQAPEVVA